MAEAKNVSFEGIMRDLEARKYAPVYYLMGDEPYYIDKIADYIINAGNANKEIESPEQFKSMIRGYLEKGDTVPIENILRLTITQQEEYPLDKK